MIQKIKGFALIFGGNFFRMNEYRTLKKDQYFMKGALSDI